MSQFEPILMVLRAPVEVREFRLQREGDDWVLTIVTMRDRLRLVNPYPLDAAWSLFMDDPSDVQIADVRSRQLERYGVEVSAVNGECQAVRFLAESAGPAVL
jgi:hypothetical protein